ncbi:PIG-L deacetylase family protein [Sphingomonas baiyangensis]|uniref:PIG-L family deacetylase n=1 Tax=Sphingomonas baiyangensis TaxID=2572576 RepID=A0A4U1L5P8_9SPHN|nr:PIG-L family deacetylase [Sphingomonas baiyangensis]TKD51536.1 PIG-L family deacetylase [Sphingomonas baiyangensis]
MRQLARPRCLLVVAPHADDEAIGAYGLIWRLRRRGVAVRILVVTDGAASHPSSSAWPPARLTSERRRETRREMRRIGVTADRIQFLSLPDGGLSTMVSSARRLIAAEVRRAPRPLTLLGPADDDDHPDHRVVAGALADCRGARVRRVSYPVWPAGRVLPHHIALPLGGQTRLAKRLAIRRYRTQAGRITDDPAGFAMTRAQVAAFSRPYETFVVHTF